MEELTTSQTVAMERSTSNEWFGERRRSPILAQKEVVE